MDANKKGIVAVGVTLGVVGLGYFLYKKWSESYPSGKEEDRAYFIKDGFVYDLDKTQRYAKKKDNWGGNFVAPIKDEKDYWLAKNSQGQSILLKKSDVKTEKKK